MSNPTDPENALDMSRRTLLRRAALAAGGAAGLALTSPASAQAPAVRRHPMPGGALVPPAAPPAATDMTTRNIDDVVKGFEKVDGVITLYRKKNDLYAEIKPEQLDKPFLLQATRATGTNGPGGLIGEPLADTVFIFQRMNDRIYLVEPNLLYRAHKDTPEAVSVERSFTEGYLGAYSIEAVRPDPAQAKTIAAIKDTTARQDALQKTARGYLVHIPSLFLADAPNFTQGIQGYAIDSDKTYLQTVKNFSGNLVVITRYAFAGHGGSPQMPDGRSFPEDVAYNLFPLEDNGYKPRFYDDRIGYFTEDYQTFDDDTSFDNARRMILRWHMVKKDPKAAVSEPVTPITFWVDNATPLRYRDAVREGVLLWNAAFEPLGYKDAVRCEIMPDDADWDPADMSHNVVQWMTSPGAGFAVARFRHNPYTGQIVNASIMIDASMARFTNLSYPSTFLTGQPADGSAGPNLTPVQLADQLMNATPVSMPSNRCECQIGLGAMQAASFGWDCLALSDDAATLDAPTLEEFTHEYIRQTIAHEAGHCMGLRHNFKGSTMLTPAQLQDKTVTAQYGVSGSVMDYLPTNMPPLGGKRADLWMPCIGPYDKWAIEYGYTDFGDAPSQEAAGLTAIAARSHEFGHIYASDENADTVDPSITRFDMGADPLAFRVAMIERSHHLLGTLEYKYPANGQSYYELTRMFMRILNQYSSNALAVARFVGGVVTYRSHAGDPGSGLPVQPVPFADQRRALHVLRQYMLSDKSLQFTPSLLAKLEQNPIPFSPLTPALPPTDFSILDAISFTQATSLLSILNPSTLGRIETNEFRVGARQDSLTVLETMQSLTDAVWKELDGKTHALPPLRRRLQRTHVDALVALFVHPSGNDSGAYAQATLRALVPKLAAAEAVSHDPTTVAHLAETRTRIVRSLHAQEIV
jgi:hypothetical protein